MRYSAEYSAVTVRRSTRNASSGCATPCPSAGRTQRTSDPVRVCPWPSASCRHRSDRRRPAANANEDGAIKLILNGEIYNFQGLRKQLLAAGHRFRSSSDTEVLVHGYEEWGMHELLNRIRGMFAFALVDQHSGTIYLATDPLERSRSFSRGPIASSSSHHPRGRCRWPSVTCFR